jgi:hypothetical protein
MMINLRRELQNLKIEEGAYITSLVKSCRCFKLLAWKTCLTEDLDDFDFKIIGGQWDQKNFIFKKSQSRTGKYVKWLPLKELRILLVDNILKEIETYFPEGSLKMFDVFNPNSLPDNIQQIYSYSRKIACLAKRFRINVVKSSHQFANILTKLVTIHKAEFCYYRKLNDPAIFWAHFLNMKILPWKAEIRKLMVIVLTLPVGSADVERAFSILNHIRYDRRSRLPPEHLEAITRIRINGPGIKDFNVVPYTLNWIANHIETDTPIYTKNEKDQMNNIPQSNLFS